MTEVFISLATPDRELVETAIVTLLNRQEISTSDLARCDDYLYARPKNWHCIFLRLGMP
jgi:hypothetical protein